MRATPARCLGLAFFFGALGLLLVGAVPDVAIGQGTAVDPKSKAGFVSDFQRIGDRVYFDAHDAALKPEWCRLLERQAAWLKHFPGYRIVIEGHTDESGSQRYNLDLGESRARSVANYLIASGLPARRISIVSYGNTRPEALEVNERTPSLNRRSVTVLR